MPRSIRDFLHQDTRLLVTDGQIRKLQSGPAGLTLREREVTRSADDLADVGMTECNSTRSAVGASPQIAEMQPSPMSPLLCVH